MDRHIGRDFRRNGQCRVPLAAYIASSLVILTVTSGCLAEDGASTPQARRFDSALPLPCLNFTVSGAVSGAFVVDVNDGADGAPLTTRNFLAHALLDEEAGSFFAGTVFHRVIPGFMVQAGGFSLRSDGYQLRSVPAPFEAIPLESRHGLHNARGTIAMARTNDPNSATSQFYINLVDNANLDYSNPSHPGYCSFGRVVQGMDVVDEIAEVPTGTRRGGMQDVPETAIEIESVVLRACPLQNDASAA